VAVTDASSRKISGSPQAPVAQLEPSAGIDLGPEGLERQQVRVDAAATDEVPSGQGQVDLPAPREQRPGEQHRRSDAARELSVDGRGADVGGGERQHVRVELADAHADVVQQGQHRVDVPDVGDVLDDHLLVRQQARGEDRQRRVLVAAGRDCSGQRPAALDDEPFGHRREGISRSRRRARRRAGRCPLDP
jgi:hypothetical protein